MLLGVLAAVGSALCYGFAAALQARGARRTAGTKGVEAGVLVRLAGQAPFVAGTALDLVGFAAQCVALRWLPVFVVQAAQASSLAVTALAAVVLLGNRLHAREWLAVVAVCVGLILLAGSSGPERPGRVGSWVHLLLLGCAAALTIAGFAAGRLGSRYRNPVLGVIAGLGFGVVALAVRALDSLNPAALVRDPATYALALGGAAAFLFYATALQGGSVTSTVAAVILGETLIPAAVGVLLLGDRTRPGFAGVAVAGFLAALLGALVLVPAAAPEPSRSRKDQVSRRG